MVEANYDDDDNNGNNNEDNNNFIKNIIYSWDKNFPDAILQC